MKIQNISLINNFRRTNKIVYNNQIKTQNLPFDTVSFRSKELDVRDILELRREADKIQSRASEVQKDAMEYLPYAKQKFQDSYNAYLKAHKYIKLIAKNPANPEIELSNGDVLRFKFVVENNGLNIEGNIFDSDENKKFTFITKGANPTKVIMYKDDNKGDIYQYSNHEIVISDDIVLNGNNAGLCDANYVFSDGQLASIRTNVNHRAFPQTSDEFYYFVDDKLAIAEIGNEMNLLMGASKNEERYTFVGEKLFNYYENFSAFGRGRLTFDESYHFVNDTFIGYSENARQIDSEGTIKADSAIYMKKGKFYQADNKTFKIKDAGIAKFDEN